MEKPANRQALVGRAKRVLNQTKLSNWTLRPFRGQAFGPKSRTPLRGAVHEPRKGKPYALDVTPAGPTQKKVAQTQKPDRQKPRKLVGGWFLVSRRGPFGQVSLRYQYLPEAWNPRLGADLF